MCKPTESAIRRHKTKEAINSDSFLKSINDAELNLRNGSIPKILVTDSPMFGAVDVKWVYDKETTDLLEKLNEIRDARIQSIITYFEATDV